MPLDAILRIIKLLMPKPKEPLEEETEDLVDLTRSPSYRILKCPSTNTNAPAAKQRRSKLHETRSPKESAVPVNDS